MTYTNSSLATYKNLFNCNYNIRTQKIDRITIHHVANGNSPATCAGVKSALLSHGGSVNYVVQSDGTIGLLLPECYRAWTTNSPENDYRAVTIEVCNCKGAPNWEVSDKALEAVIKLCADICKRNGISKLTFTGQLAGSNLTMHKWFWATSCPEKYLSSKFPYIRDEVNKRLNAGSDDGKKSEDDKKPVDNTKPKVPYLVKITCKGGLNVRTGAGVNNPINNSCKLVPYGGVYTIVDTKTVSGQLWGKLKSGAGWICLTGYTEVYNKAPASNKKSVDEIAKEVIQGKWGNGTDRVRKLTDAGYDYNTVQRRVNEMLG